MRSQSNIEHKSVICAELLKGTATFVILYGILNTTLNDFIPINLQVFSTLSRNFLVILMHQSNIIIFFLNYKYLKIH